MSKKHLVLYGTSDELIHLRLMELVNEAHTKGFDVFYLDGKVSTLAEISEATDVGLFGEVNRLVVVERVGSLKDADKIISQNEVPCVFLAGKTPPKSLMGLSRKEVFEEPKGYQKEEWCVAYFTKLLKSQGKTASPAIVKSIVKRVGVDLGVLRWEAFKLKYASEGEEVTPKEVVSVLSPLSELDGLHLVDAVFSGDPKHFLKICARFESIRKGDPTIPVATGLLHTNLLSALEIRLLLKSGVTSPQEIGLKIGKNGWLVGNVLLPKSKVFSEKKLRQLLGVLFRAENLALSGSLGAWEGLKVGIVKIMIS